MRRVKQAAMLLVMAAAAGWSGPASDAQASRPEAEAAHPEVALPTLAEATGRVASSGRGEWRYVSTRR